MLSTKRFLVVSQYDHLLAFVGVLRRCRHHCVDLDFLVVHVHFPGNSASGLRDISIHHDFCRHHDVDFSENLPSADAVSHGANNVLLQQADPNVAAKDFQTPKVET